MAYDDVKEILSLYEQFTDTSTSKKQKKSLLERSESLEANLLPCEAKAIKEILSTRFDNFIENFTQDLETSTAESKAKDETRRIQSEQYNADFQQLHKELLTYRATRELEDSTTTPPIIH